jgi:hypothetical protein
MILLDDIFVYENENMPCGAAEMVCPNADGSYTILLNSKLTAERQSEAFWHAIGHIENHDFERIEEYGVQLVESQAHQKGVPPCGKSPETMPYTTANVSKILSQGVRELSE